MKRVFQAVYRASKYGRAVPRAAAVAILLMLAALFQSSVGHADQWGQISARLSRDMTEEQVVKQAGRQPAKVEMSACGSQTRTGAWMCKVYTFGNPAAALLVFFHERSNGWLVVGWQVYP